MQCSNKHKRPLKPGEMPECFFWSLIKLSPFRSERVVHALKDFLVIGCTKKEVCERYKVSCSYFSVALQKILYINDITEQLNSQH
ncbi:PapB/FocB family fimbrial expression transcriptional regulator [Escherichia coli]|uniref:PapB/FocB family fimbrial expression transcriptional regulator n=1 Tax=Escherichia coli TaxID=562 RepID=UPI0035BE9878